MKSRITKLTAFLFFALILSACSKDDVFQKPIPAPTDDAGKPEDSIAFRFATTLDITGQPYHSSSFTAVVSIADAKDYEVIVEKTLQLDLSGAVKTGVIKLPAGGYKLTKFRLVYGAVSTHFATPIANSAKAALVQKPLAIAFQLATGTAADVPVEVVKVQAGDRPKAFGYPSGGFDNGQSDADPYVRVKIATMRQIGKIRYDSVPASLTLTTWDRNGERSLAFVSLHAGITEVALLKSGARFQLDVSRWGITNKLMLERDEVNADTVYTMSGSREAKRLQSEVTTRLVDGRFVPESKNIYMYDAAGNLTQVDYYQQSKSNKLLLAMKEIFEYSGAEVRKITRYDENNKAIGVTEFGYDNQGKVRSINHDENGMETVAAVAYANYGYPSTTIHYTYTGQSHTMDYYMTFDNGNVVNDNAAVSGYSKEEGRYDHDTEINPYAHMNWPNLFLSKTSKNNIVAQYKNYYGNHPSAIPYSFKYSYDGDGYPKELVKQFHPYGENQHLYTTKTTYTY